MRVAFIHDWLLGMRGGEKCLDVLCRLFPESEIFTLFYDAKSVSRDIASRPVHASVLNKLPNVQRSYRHLLPAYSVGVNSLSSQLEVRHRARRFDLVMSISHCVAKNVRAPQGVPHVCYCLTPMRYIWDQFDSYFKGRRIEPIARLVAPPLRRWDVATAQGVTGFIGISAFIQERIRKYYGRESEVIFPPVDTSFITPRRPDERGEGFLCVNALVPYKNTETIVRGFNLLGLPLTVIGSGPEEAKLKELACENVTFKSNLSDIELGVEYRKAKALVFGAEEDFGMTPVEAQAAGRPVIALGRGGVLETVSVKGEAPTGVFFAEPTADAVAKSVEYFLDRELEFTVNNCVRQAERFGVVQFEQSITSYVARQFQGLRASNA